MAVDKKKNMHVAYKYITEQLCNLAIKIADHFYPMSQELVVAVINQKFTVIILKSSDLHFRLNRFLKEIKVLFKNGPTC